MGPVATPVVCRQLSGAFSTRKIFMEYLLGTYLCLGKDWGLDMKSDMRRSSLWHFPGIDEIPTRDTIVTGISWQTGRSEYVSQFRTDKTYYLPQWAEKIAAVASPVPQQQSRLTSRGL